MRLFDEMHNNTLGNVDKWRQQIVGRPCDFWPIIRWGWFHKCFHKYICACEAVFLLSSQQIFFGIGGAYE